uniref:Odorant Binding Protein 45 n=1 Tax=Dendrolimus punctatus TaxID=238572 RepID=A0A2K8GKQ9_9NEOP|nr:Odorant Binding Protein 45 [Dendrolimus punctatus]
MGYKSIMQLLVFRTTLHSLGKGINLLFCIGKIAVHLKMQIHSSLSLFVVCAILFTGQTNCAKTAVKAPAELAGPILETMSVCSQETNTKQEWIMAAMAENKVFENEAFMKFMDCTFQKSGYAKPDGTLDVEKSVKIFPKNFDMKTVFENCNKNKGSTRVETTFKVFKCYQQTSPVQLAF